MPRFFFQSKKIKVQECPDTKKLVHAVLNLIEIIKYIMQIHISLAKYNFMHPWCTPINFDIQNQPPSNLSFLQYLKQKS